MVKNRANGSSEIGLERRGMTDRHMPKEKEVSWQMQKPGNYKESGSSVRKSRHSSRIPNSACLFWCYTQDAIAGEVVQHRERSIGHLKAKNKRRRYCQCSFRCFRRVISKPRLRWMGWSGIGVLNRLASAVAVHTRSSCKVKISLPSPWSLRPVVCLVSADSLRRTLHHKLVEIQTSPSFCPFCSRTISPQRRCTDPVAGTFSLPFLCTFSFAIFGSEYSDGRHSVHPIL